MNEIRAFVGHSFLEDDAELVAKFLKYFERIEKLLSYFSWEHAEAAEPRLLTEKVMWPAPGSEDTELGVLMEPEVGHGEAEVYT